MTDITNNVRYIEGALKELGINHTSGQADPQFWSDINSFLRKLQPLVEGLPSEYNDKTGPFMLRKLDEQKGLLGALDVTYKALKLASPEKALETLDQMAKAAGHNIPPDVLPLVPKLIEFSKKAPEFKEQMDGILTASRQPAAAPAPAAAAAPSSFTAPLRFTKATKAPPSPPPTPAPTPGERPAAKETVPAAPPAPVTPPPAANVSGKPDPATFPNPPVLGPDGKMTLAEAIPLVEQALINTIAFAKTYDASAKFTTPGTPGGEFDESSRIAGYEVLITLQKQLGMQPAAEYTPALGKTLLAKFKEPQYAGHKFLIEDNDGSPLKSLGGVEKLVLALDTLDANKRLGRAPGTATAGAPVQKQSLSETESKIMRWAVGMDKARTDFNPAQLPLLDEIMFENSRFNFRDYGLKLPGIERPSIESNRHARMEQVFTKAFSGNKSFAENKAVLMESVDALMQLSFGPAARREAYKKLIEAALVDAEKASADGKDMSKAATAFASRFTEANIDIVNKPFGGGAGLAYRRDPSQTVIDRRLYEFGTSDVPEAVNIVFKAWDNKNYGQPEKTGIFFRENNGDSDPANDKIFFADREKDTGIFTLYPTNLKTISEIVAKHNVGASNSINPADPDYEKKYKALETASEALHAELMEKDAGYRFAFKNSSGQFGNYDNFIRQAQAAVTLKKEFDNNKASVEAVKAESASALAAAAAAKKPDAENTNAPPATEVEARVAGQPSSGRGTGGRRPSGSSSDSAGTAPLSRRAPAPGFADAHTPAGNVQAVRDGKFETNNQGGNKWLRDSIDTNIDRNGRLGVEYLDQGNKAHMADLTKAAAFLTSFMSPLPDKEHEKIRLTILKEEMGGRREPPAITDPKYLEYVQRVLDETTHEKLNDVLARKSPDIVELQRFAKYPQIRALSYASIVQAAEVQHKDINGLVHPRGHVHSDESVSLKDRPNPSVTYSGRIKLDYIDPETGKAARGDVTSQVAYFRSLQNEFLLEWKKSGDEKWKNTPHADDKNFKKFVLDLLDKRGIDLGDKLARFSSSREDWLGTVQPNHTNETLVNLLWQIERDHEKFAPGHNDHRGGLSGEWDRNKGAARDSGSERVYAEQKRTPEEPKTTRKEREESINGINQDSDGIWSKIGHKIVDLGHTYVAGAHK